MPPVRLPSHAEARSGALAQYALVASAVEALRDKDFRRPTRLGTWSVAELVAHLAATADAVTRSFGKPEPVRAEVDLLGYLDAMRGVAPAVARRAADLAEGATPAQLTARLAAAVAAATAALEHADPDRLVLVRLGAIRLGDFLVTRCVEGVVHGFDLRAATGAPSMPDQTALKVVVKAFAALLAHVAPGRGVEVRVPGPAGTAVQCGEGPRHARGTPPNVVEAGAEAFVELCAGRLGWAQATATGLVTASGERADLSPYVPLIG